MACCILAAFLIAQMMATFRRWGIFWGVVRPTEDDDPIDTAYTRVLHFLRRPAMRRAMVGLVALEAATVGTWLYTDHREHIVQLADVAWSSLQGEEVIYASQCGPNSKLPARIVLTDMRAQ